MYCNAYVMSGHEGAKVTDTHVLLNTTMNRLNSRIKHIGFLLVLFGIFLSSTGSLHAQCHGQPLLGNGTGAIPGSDWNGADGVCLCGGEFICIQDYGTGCICDGTSNCKYIHIRNLNTNGCAIDKVEIRFKQDPNSTKFNVCTPHKNYGDDCWTSLYSPHNMSSNTYFTTNFCHDWSTQQKDANGYMRVQFEPPASLPTNCLDGDNTWLISMLDHFTVTICGGTDFTIILHYVGDVTPDTYTPGDNIGPCPTTGA
jgi:hypothetical protein